MIFSNLNSNLSNLAANLNQINEKPQIKAQQFPTLNLLEKFNSAPTASDFKDLMSKYKNAGDFINEIFGVDRQNDKDWINKALKKANELQAGLSKEYLFHIMTTNNYDEFSEVDKFNVAVNGVKNMILRGSKGGKLTFLGMSHLKMGERHQEITELLNKKTFDKTLGTHNAFFIAANSTLDDMSFEEFRDLVDKASGEFQAQNKEKNDNFSDKINSNLSQTQAEKSSETNEKNAKKRKAIQGFSKNMKNETNEYFKTYYEIMNNLGAKNMQTLSILDLLINQKEIRV